MNETVSVDLSVEEAVQLLTELNRMARYMTPGSEGLSRCKAGAVKLATAIKRSVGGNPPRQSDGLANALAAPRHRPLASSSRTPNSVARGQR